MNRMTCFFTVAITTLVQLYAQGPPSSPKLFDRIVWRGIDERYLLPFSPNSPVLCDRIGSRSQLSIFQPAKEEGNGWSIRGDYLYFIQSKIKNDKEIISLLQTNLNHPKPTWDVLGVIDSSKGVPFFIIPTDEPNYYLAFNWMDGFVHNDKASFAAIFQLSDEKKEFTLTSIIDMPFDELSTIGKLAIIDNNIINKLTDTTGTKNTFCQAFRQALHPTLWSPVITRNRVFIAATRPGVIWVFNLKNGTCEKVLNLGNVKNDEIEQLDFINHFILGMQPSYNDDVIVATRDLEILNSAIHLKRTAGRTAELVQAARFTYHALHKDNGNILWWKIDSENLTPKIMNNPIVAYDQMINYNQATVLKFNVSENEEIITNYSKGWSNFPPRVKKETSTVTTNVESNKKAQAPKK